MAEVQTLRRGNIYEEDNQLWRVLDYQHIKMARGGATIRLKVRNVRTGATVEKTYNSGARVQDVRLDSRQVQYLYNDGQFYYFMDTDTFEQIALPPEALEGIVEYLVDNQVVTLLSYNGEPIEVSLPTTVDLKVVWAEAAVAGDTANAPTKQVELETGLRMQVPMFVNEGDIIRVDTRDGSYVTRVQK
ncbi:elongation factor P [Litorilinea aerophila]|uniref:Elongation factor P n=1 Tax=Litorilinea aerophila TaxID=1204385 RepID=A0A540V9U1_9CHLR|nr:elongation factor P [Litorilinea aerophila]MCC9078616.1 elongation factor P [Litorilinea aerophila]GIV77055.1 MAG: elongation factor P [Litorilinea sp.]